MSDKAIGKVEHIEPLHHELCFNVPEDVDEPKGGKSSAGGGESKSKRDGNRRKRNKGRS